MKQGADLKVTGRVHDVKTPERGPKVLVVQVNHGKDKEGKYRPSTFIDCKVFPSKEQQLLTVRPVKGDLVEVTCWGSTSEWTNKEGIKQRKLEWGFAHIEMLERASDRNYARSVNIPAPIVEDDDVPF